MICLNFPISLWKERDTYQLHTMNSLIPQWFNISLPDFSLIDSLTEFSDPSLIRNDQTWFLRSFLDSTPPFLISMTPSWLCLPLHDNPLSSPPLFSISLWWPLTCRTSTCSCFALTADCWVADTASSSWILSSSSRQRSLSALSSFSTFTRLVWHWFSLSSVRNCQRGKKRHLIEQIYCKQNFIKFESTSW